MKVIVKNKEKEKKVANGVNTILEWLISMFCYAVILLLATNIFKSLYIANFWAGLAAAVIIFVLNKTLKPALVTLSIPLIGMSLGLFYFIINVGILFLTDLILGKYFTVNGFWSGVLISIFLSITNLLVENIVVKPLVERCKK